MSGVSPETSSGKESFIEQEINKLQKAINEINGVIEKQSSEGNEEHKTIEDIVELISNESATIQADKDKKFNKVTLGCLLVCKKQIDEKKKKLEEDQKKFTSIPCSELNDNEGYYACVKSLEEGEVELLKSNRDKKLLDFKHNYIPAVIRDLQWMKIDINFNDDEKVNIIEESRKSIQDLKRNKSFQNVISELEKENDIPNNNLKQYINDFKDHLIFRKIIPTLNKCIEEIENSPVELPNIDEKFRKIILLLMKEGDLGEAEIKELEENIKGLEESLRIKENFGKGNNETFEKILEDLPNDWKDLSLPNEIIPKLDKCIEEIRNSPVELPMSYEIFGNILMDIKGLEGDSREAKIEEVKANIKDLEESLKVKGKIESLERIIGWLGKSSIKPTEIVKKIEDYICKLINKEDFEIDELLESTIESIATCESYLNNQSRINKELSNEIIGCIRTIEEKELPMSMWILINDTIRIIAHIKELKNNRHLKINVGKLTENITDLKNCIKLEEKTERLKTKIKGHKQKLNSLRWVSELFKPFLGREKSIEVFNKYKKAFFGNDENMLKEFLNKNEEGGLSGGFKPLAAIGIPGAGKTTFIKNMSAEVNEEEFISVVVTYSDPVKLSTDKEDEHIEHFTTQLLSSNGISDETAQSPPPLKDIIEQIFDLKECKECKGMIIFVDDLIPHDDKQIGNVRSLISALMTIQDDSRKNSNKRVMFVFTGLDSDYLTTDGSIRSISSIPLYNLSPENSILAIADEKMNKEMKEKIKEMKEKTKEEIEGMNKKMKEKIKEMKEKTKEEIEGMNKKMKEKMNKEMKEKIKEMNEEMNKKIKEINKKMKKKMNKEIKEINKKMNAEMKKKMKVIRESKSLWQSFLSCGGNPGLLSLLDTNDSESVFSYKIKESYSRVKLNIINNFLNYENVCRWFTGSVSGDDLELWKEKGLIQDADGLQYLVPQLLRLWANDDNNDDINGNNNLIKLLKNHLRDAYEGDVLCVPGQEKNMETVTMNFECIRKILLVNKEVVTVKDFFAGAMFSDEKFEKEKLKIIIPESEKTSLVKFAENLGQSEDVDSSKTETENSSKTRQKNKGYNGKHDKKILNYLKDGYTVASEKQNEKGVERIVPFYCGDDLLVALMQDKFVSTTDYWSAAKDNILKSPCVEFLKRKGIQYFVVFNTTFYEHEDISSWGEGGIGHKPIGCVHFTGTALVESTSRFGPLKLNCAKLKVTVKGKTEYSPVKKVYPHLHKDYNGL